MADTVTIHFKGNASGEYPRDVVRAIFGLVDNVLQDLGEPAEITVPVHIKSFEKLFARALSIMRGQDSGPCCAKTAEFLLYTFDDATTAAALILDSPVLRRLTTPGGSLVAIARIDRREMIKDILTVCPEALVAEAIAQYEAERCLADWLAKSRNIESMLPVATAKNIYKPLIKRLHETDSLSLLKLATPVARRYSFKSHGEKLPSAEIYRVYLDAAVRLNDKHFTGSLDYAAGIRFSEIDVAGIGFSIYSPRHIKEFGLMFDQMRAEFLRDGRADLYATMDSYGLVPDA